MYGSVYNRGMILSWDETKRLANIRKYGIDFADAEIVFEGNTFTLEDNRFDYDEMRFITLGLLQDIVVVIAHTERKDSIRIISMRKADKHEQRRYYQSVND